MIWFLDRKVDISAESAEASKSRGLGTTSPLPSVHLAFPTDKHQELGRSAGQRLSSPSPEAVRPHSTSLKYLLPSPHTTKSVRFSPFVEEQTEDKELMSFATT